MKFMCEAGEITSSSKSVWRIKWLHVKSFALPAQLAPNTCSHCCHHLCLTHTSFLSPKGGANNIFEWTPLLSLQTQPLYNIVSSSIIFFLYSSLPYYTHDTSLFNSVQLLSHAQLFATPWTAAHQTSLSLLNIVIL